MTFAFAVEQVDVHSALRKLAYWQIEINQPARQLLLQRLLCKSFWTESRIWKKLDSTSTLG
jgi:hypothetical protein